MTVIEFRKRVSKEHKDLTSLLKHATDLRNRLPNESEKKVYDDLKNLLSGKICSMLIEKRMIDFGLFACGIYVADVLNNLTTEEPESWYAIDYFLKGYKENNPEILRQGANTCFLICSIFQARGNRRTMKVSDYQKMRIGFFMQYYNQTGKEIGFHMGKNFPVMAEVAEKCIKTL